MHNTQNNTNNGSKMSHIKFRIFFWVAGLASLIWFIIRVVPKPSRAAYPCMRASMPLASAFVLHILSLSGSFFLLGRFKRLMSMRYARYFVLPALVVLPAISLYYMGSNSFAHVDINGGSKTLFADPLGPNNPIGQARGSNPGRVVWAFNPQATNPDCIPYEYGDGFFLPHNSDQEIINQMLSESLQLLTDAQNDPDAWHEIFRYFNDSRMQQDRGYLAGEKIFVKTNSVQAWNTDPQGNIPDNNRYGFVDTSPQVVLAVLKQLVEKAGVPQNMIYVGDPFTKMFNHNYHLWNDQYPDVRYFSREAQPGREVFTKTTEKSIFYSDQGEIMGQTYDKMIDQMAQADYLINIPALKGHRWSGVTFFAKNHFGSHARGTSVHLHSGLHRTDYDDPLRDDYRMYRPFVDMMAHEHLGDKTLIYIMDGLWATSMEHLPPVKFTSHPFNNHWSSSILVSQDPVAIESVCLDILQKEFHKEDLESFPPIYTYVHWNAVDDYLHQAACDQWWPEGMIYDPNNTGSPIQSLGVHEHWNNNTDMQYSRNLGQGNGIELIKYFKDATPAENERLHGEFFDLTISPNPSHGTKTRFVVELKHPCNISIDLYDLSGRKVSPIAEAFLAEGSHAFWHDTSSLRPGTYLAVYSISGTANTKRITKKLIIN